MTPNAHIEIVIKVFFNIVFKILRNDNNCVNPNLNDHIKDYLPLTFNNFISSFKYTQKLFDMKRIALLLLLIVGFASCTDYDQVILPVVGFYDARVIGVSGGFEMNVAADGGKNVIIEAPFDGDVWKIIRARFQDRDDFRKEINISRQSLGDGVEIWGDGFYYDGNIQLDYKISFWGDTYQYKIIGSQY